MANKKDVYQVWRCYGTGTGGYRRLEPMNEAELAGRAVSQQQAQREVIDRQIAEEARFLVKPLPLRYLRKVAYLLSPAIYRTQSSIITNRPVMCLLIG